MAAREDTARDVQHEPARHGRHGRPRPFGGRLRLPTLRFSGAAMAMSTVVGISIATTLLLNEQQGIGRRAGVARVGTTPPPTPGATDQAEEVAAQSPAATSSAGGPSGARPSAHPSTHPSAHTSAAPVAATPPAARSANPPAPAGRQTAEGQASGGQDAPPPGTLLTGTEAGAPAPAGPSPAAHPLAPTADRPAPGQSPNVPVVKPTAPTAPARPGPPPAATVPGTGSAPGCPAPAPADPGAATPGTGPDGTDADHALSGAALVAPLGRDGLRHELVLTVTEPVTALQTEFRLAAGESAAGSGTAWTDLPGAVVTAQQERGTLVYRFTTPPGTDVRPGHYTFGVRGTRPAATDPSAARKSAPAESWSASAFAIDQPRAVAALGGFGPVPPLSVPQAPGVAPVRGMAPAPGRAVAPQAPASR
ncbi:hypothetical protein [Streptomyces pyridomyceticus]|uniref:hypothetical protein n=1 Tax=Streptomyces pyridomyceticus TaxID=68260 RepID=UPI0004C223E1|nr:hypothetical protein [Streptomyces pyridomyceticus]